MKFVLAETMDDVFQQVLPGLKKKGAAPSRRPRPALVSANGHTDELPVEAEAVINS